MSDHTPILALPLLSPNQSEPHVPINEALNILDTAVGANAGLTVEGDGQSPIVEVNPCARIIFDGGATVEEQTAGVALVTVGIEVASSDSPADDFQPIWRITMSGGMQISHPVPGTAHIDIPAGLEVASADSPGDDFANISKLEFSGGVNITNPSPGVALVTVTAAGGAAANGIPAGGSAGQVLEKIDGTNYNTDWITPHNVPVGGSTGQALVKNSGTDYDYSWTTPSTPAASDIFDVFMGHRVAFMYADGATTPMPRFGSMTNTESGSTWSNPAPDPTTLIGAMIRRLYTSAAASNTSGTMYWGRGQVANQNFYRRISADTARGGFKMRLLFAPVTARNTQAVMIGVANANSDATINGAISTAYTNFVALAKDQGDTNIQMMHNDGSGTATKVDVGITWASLQGKLCQLTIECNAGGSTVLWELKNITDNATYSGTLSTDLPAIDAPLGCFYQVSTGSLASTAIAIAYMRATIKIYDYQSP